MTTTAERTREQRRRAARHQGLTLQKSRLRDSRALDYGKWLVLDAQGRMVGRELRNLDEVERYLNGEDR